MGPFVLYDGKYLLEKWFDGTQNHVIIDRNDLGFMDPKSFRTYVDKVVIPYLQNLDKESPRSPEESLVSFFPCKHGNVYYISKIFL